MRKPDRRVKRTHKQLNDALFALIEEKGYDAITVQDIVDRADLSRATFYLHYRDKEELLVSSLEEMFDALVDIKGQLTPELILSVENPPCLIAFQHAKDFNALYKILLSERGVAYVMHRIHTYLAGVARQEIETLLPPDFEPSVPLDIIANHFAGSLFGVLVWWVQNDMPHSPEYMAQTFQKIMIPSVLSALGIGLPLANFA